jgi:hypothetical protein
MRFGRKPSSARSEQGDQAIAKRVGRPLRQPEARVGRRPEPSTVNAPGDALSYDRQCPRFDAQTSGRQSREQSSRIGRRQRRACRSTPPEFLIPSAMPARSGPSCTRCRGYPEGMLPGRPRRRTVADTFHAVACLLHVELGIQSNNSFLICLREVPQRWDTLAVFIGIISHSAGTMIASVSTPEWQGERER